MTLMWDARQVTVPEDWLRVPLTVTAEVRSVQSFSGYSRLVLDDVQQADGPGLAGLALLYVHGGKAADVLAGDRIRATARWRLPENRRNPGAFDYRAYCFDHHIALIGSLRRHILVTGSDATWLQRARQRIQQALAALPDAEGGVLSALLLADRSRIPTDVWDAFAASGAAHLLAISGLHVGMVALFTGLLCWWVLSRREAWIVCWPLRRLCLAAGIAAAVTYATLAGWPLPARRAVLMLAATATAWWMRDRAVPLNTLLAALILILFFDAGAITSISLWLSFAAAGALLIWAGHRYEHRSRLGPWLTALLWTSLVAMLATLPIVAQVFGRLPVYGLLANLLLVPMYSFVILPVTLFGGVAAVVGQPTAAQLIFVVAGKAVHWGNSMLLTMHAWPGGNLWIPTLPLWPGLLYAAGMIAAGCMLLRRRRMPALGLAVLTLTVYVSVAITERPPAQPEFVAWDAGQGAAASLLLPDGKVVSVDAPGVKGSRFNGGTITAAGLRALGAAHVDVLVISHAQADHMGGIPRLIDQVRRVNEVWLADVPYNHALAAVHDIIVRVRSRGGVVRWLAAGDSFRAMDLNVRVLWPPVGYDPANHNNTSLVLSLHLPGGTSLLLPGDIEAQAEARLVAAGLEPHDVVLVPHHGSRTSSTPDWVRVVAPTTAIIQSGRHNRYGFPALAVAARYAAGGAQVWNTAKGAVVMRLPGQGAGQVRAVSYWKALDGRRQRALQWWQRHL